MAEGKRYFWLKLHDDFFSSKRIKKLRKMAGGDTYTIIYLKMQLLAMKSDGILKFTGLESDFAEELALDIDEEPDNVKVTLAYLLSCGLAETEDNINFFLPYSVENVGSEGSSAQRMREKRKAIAEHKNEQCATLCEHRDGEIEKEIDIEIDIEKRESNKLSRHKFGNYSNVLLTQEDYDKWHQECPKADEYIEKLSEYMASSGKSYKNHLATLRNWYRRDKEKEPKDQREASYDLPLTEKLIKQKLVYKNRTVNEMRNNYV